MPIWTIIEPQNCLEYTVLLPSYGQNRPVNLPVSSDKTSAKSYLKHHHLTHTGERSFECDQCDYSASQKRDLDRHKLDSHTVVSRILPVPCVHIKLLEKVPLSLISEHTQETNPLYVIHVLMLQCAHQI